MRISDWSSDVCSSDLFNDVEAALNVAAGVSNHLAMFGRKRPRQFFDILLNQFLEAEHDARAALRIHSGPTGLRSIRRFNRKTQMSRGERESGVEGQSVKVV